VDGVISYLNTDLDLTSLDDLTVLARAFEAGGIFPLHVTRGEDGLWYATFEVLDQYTEPEPSIAAMLAVVESLEPPLRSIWTGCSLREFNIGYDCGLQPWAFNQGLSAELLGRIAAAGASLRVTLYPDRAAGHRLAKKGSKATPKKRAPAVGKQGRAKKGRAK
jgi:hypothetical protein